MKPAALQRNERTDRESGQAVVTLVLLLGTFLLGVLGFAVDFANLWFHQQRAQAAADAACQAGAMDLLAISQGTGTATSAGFTPGTSFDCASASTAAPCKYAALNNYASPGLTTGTESNDVAVSFPGSVSGVTAPPQSLAGSYPFLRVDVTDRVKVFLSGLLTGSKTQDVVRTAKCGLVLAQAPIPIVVLNPTITNALSVQGTPNIIISGGPDQSVQVNSTSSTAVNIGGNATIDLRLGGPNLSGSSLGVSGGPYSAPGGFLSGSPLAQYWNAPSSPISDPFAQLAAPSSTLMVQRSGPISTTVPYGSLGCPDNSTSSSSTCDEYAPGYYSKVLQVKGRTAIFDPGVYYLAAGLVLDSNSIVRPSTNTGNYDGTMFYLSGTSSVSVAADSGTRTKNIDAFVTSRVSCPSGATVTIKDSSGNAVTSLNGNILLGVCTGPYGDPLGQYRGMLFFQDRSSILSKTNQPAWTGGGQFILAGNMYFHMCNSDGSGGQCSSASAYSDVFTLQGNSGSGTYVLGDIVADQLALGGTSNIVMQLNPYAAYSVLRVALLQ